MQIENSQPIGVFDSGIGGLTVLEQLIKIFPHENFYYVADQGYCPYGPRPAEYVCERVEKITRHMVNEGVKAIVIACNTASLRIASARAVTDIPVVSVIPPTCMRAVETTKNKKVAVLATQATINIGTYQNMLKENGVTPVPLACGEFVDFLENDDLDNPYAYKLVADKLASIKDEGFDTLIHACTHFSLLEPQMRAVLGDINYVNCGTPTGEYLKKYFDENNLATNATDKGRVRIFTTGEVDGALRTMRWFKAEHDPVAHVDIK